MRRNKKRTKHMSLVTEQALHVVVIVFMLFVMAIINMLASSRCDNLMKSIGKKERELRQCEADYQRELSRWERLNTPEQLEKALRSHGLSMHLPKPSQIVRMNGSSPVPGQLSVAKAIQRSNNRNSAQNISSASTRRGGVTRRR